MIMILLVHKNGTNSLDLSGESCVCLVMMDNFEYLFCWLQKASALKYLDSDDK